MKRTPLRRRTPMRSKPKRTPVKIADELFSKSVRARDRRCVLADVLPGECWGPLAACHLIRRGNHAVRWYEDNVHTECVVHHMEIDTHRAVLWMVAMSLLGPERVAELIRRAADGPSEDPRDVIARLKGARRD